MSKIIPINNSVSINSTSSSILVNNKKQPIPIINDNNDIIIQVNNIGPIGPPGKTGNGILKVEKTSTSGLIDIYTMYFTDGSNFSYEITNGIVHYYDGSYEVTPSSFPQSLSTENLVMRNNVNIKEIPYYEVLNQSGGKTVTIGDN